MLAATVGRWTEAEQHFDEALVVNERLGARTFVVRTRRAYASMLIERGEPGDAARAVGLAEEGLRTATELSMGAEVERLRSLLDRARRREIELART
jgi:hypothetical protein